MWPSLIKKAKNGGLNAIETYVFWSAHEPQYRHYDFSGNLDIVRFLKIVQDEGLYAILRIGPYVCAEWNFGGLPVWLANMPGVEFRSGNVFMNEMKNFTTLIGDMMKKENLLASQGGPIILAQIENEYGLVSSTFGERGKSYLNFTLDLAESLKLNVPWIMCQQWDVPQMYHGGTNFGRTAGGPYIATSYDYNAPLDEYGNLNQPKWGHLKQLHLLLRSMEKILTYGDVKSINHRNVVSTTTYNLKGERACFFGNANDTDDATVVFEGKKIVIPAWSVSIFPDCSTEAYNTARVNTQTSVMVKKPNEADSKPLEWQWRTEHFDHLSSHSSSKRSKAVKGLSSAMQLLDQKAVTNDTSDYLWYITSVDVDGNDTIWAHKVTLQVRTSGHALHAYVNGIHIGSQFAKIRNFRFTFERDVKLRQGKNIIALLSATVGLPNSGAKYETIQHGVIGPVMLIAMDNQAKDLSWNKWVYKVGLHGEDEQLYNLCRNHGWKTENFPIHRSFVWYKTSFKSPRGEDPIVVDLLGMNKGNAWVNGNHIGRYWPGYLAVQDGCDSTCDYRGKYNPNKCLSNCGQPSQRWYSFFNFNSN
ncbi:UNVERIFIED_CONTAM: Beta-galactosidase 7 [Sesamum latifolium]|uniref:beta-galactosidase n=1 Tax=Sesamum latifolium TaxID=2727402 RepID=A0AAW2XQC8_9LAMI